MRSMVKVRLAERRMTKRELAKTLGVTEMTLWRWCTDEGIAKLPFYKLAALAEAIGCEPEDLYER